MPLLNIFVTEGTDLAHHVCTRSWSFSESEGVCPVIGQGIPKRAQAM